MPQVTVDLVSLDNKPLAGRSCCFEGSGGTIGRDQGNTLALPDPHRRVSRLHATISFPGGVPTITNSSAVLPINVSGTSLACGEAVPLAPGMHVEIGPYVLAVRPGEPWITDPLSGTDGATLMVPKASSPFQALLAASPLAAPPLAPSPSPPPSLLAPSSLPPGMPAPASSTHQGLQPRPLGPTDDPLAMLLGSAPAAMPPVDMQGLASASDPLAAFGIAQHPLAEPPGALEPGPALAGHPPPAAIIPDDFNPFELPTATARNTADPLASLGGSAAAPLHGLTADADSIDAMFQPVPGGSADGLLNGHVGGDLLGQVAGEPAFLSRPETTDPLALFGAAPSTPERFGGPMRDDLAEIGGAYQPPAAIEPVRVSPPVLTVPTPPRSPPVAPVPRPPATGRADVSATATAPTGSTEELTQAFLRGAGLAATTLPNGLTPESMEMIGSLLRSATTGAIDMLAIRANIKREVQASATIISTEANNPLKFLHDADSVLQLFFGKRMRGFMAPDEAMKDAFNDLGAHELGVIAGTRAALNEVLTSFDPAILGERLARGSRLEMALPAMRKTRLWDLYLERYAQIRREVEDDFQSIFGKAFVAAYEAEAARMKARTAGGEPT